MSLSPSYTRKKGLQPTDNEKKNQTCVHLLFKWPVYLNHYWIFTCKITWRRRDLVIQKPTTATRTSQNKRFIKWLCTCVIIFGVFHYRPLQNNNVKWPTSALSGEREPRRQFCFKSLFRIFAGFHIQFRGSFNNEKQTKWLKSIARFEGKIQIHFCNRRCPRRSRLKVNEVWTPGCSKTSDVPCSCTALNSHRNSLYQRL